MCKYSPGCVACGSTLSLLMRIILIIQIKVIIRIINNYDDASTNAHIQFILNALETKLLGQKVIIQLNDFIVIFGYLTISGIVMAIWQVRNLLIPMSIFVFRCVVAELRDHISTQIMTM